MPSYFTPSVLMPATDPTPPTKRRRTSSTHATNPNPITRSDIWFEDGSVILQAELKQFRVHRTMLARHSTVFKDMFSMPQPQGEAAIEGCPIVHLSDTAEDIHHILTALYDKGYNMRQALPFPVIAALLRLGKKYEFDHLRDVALLRLTSEFPTKLEEWDALPDHFAHIVYRKGLLYDIIDLAIECGVQSILPAAYFLAADNAFSILSGQERDDGTVAQLPPLAQKACLFGRERIIDALADYTYRWLDDDDITEPCASTSCEKACLKMIRNIWRSRPDPTIALKKWSDVEVVGLCGVCLNAAEGVHEAERVLLWSILPSLFDLRSWSGLKNFEM